MNPKQLWSIVKQVASEWSEDKISRLAAALAYYAAFSLAPILVIVLAIAGLVVDKTTAQDEILAQMNGLMGAEGAGAVETLLENSAQSEQQSLWAAVLGIATLIFGATGVFVQLQDALNTIWEVEPKPGLGFGAMIRTRFLSFTMVLVIGFLLLISLVVSAGLSAMGNYVGGLLPDYELLWQVVNFVVSFAVITLLFAMIFKFLPDVEIAWRDVWMGAVVTTVLFLIGKYLIGLYLGRSAVGSTFGAAGSFAILLLWVYYSAQILLIGAEFTQVYANRYGTDIRPAEHAVPVTEEARAQQGIPRKEQVEVAAQE
jgi:membrane protein